MRGLDGKAMSDEDATVLLVERDPELGRGLLAFLEERGHAAEWVDSLEKAYNRIDAQAYDVIVANLKMQRGPVMRLMAVAHDRNPDVCVIFITDERGVPLAVEAMRQGAYDFVVRPVNLERLDAVIRRGLEHQRLALKHISLQRRLDERFGLGSLAGQSRQMIQVYNAVRQFGPRPDPVLIVGEPGSGKERIAQALHNNSPRRDDPFVKLQCAGVSEAILDRELFGWGPDAAYPGDRPQAGCAVLADRGTLYLDGITEVPARLQDKLVELLTRGSVVRGGDAKRIVVDVRVIAATDRRVDAAARSGFDPRLWKALSNVIIEAPALRTRREDIPLLIDQAMQRAAAFAKRRVDGIDREAVNLLQRYDWPGNCRELENIIEGIVITMGHRTTIGVQDIPEHIRRAAAPENGEIRIPAGASMSQIERIVIEETMRRCGYNKEKCAKTLGIGLRTLYRKLREYEEA